MCIRDRVYAEETGEVSEPVSMGGGTYAKSLPNTVAFGPIFPGHEDTMHQANEHITEDDLEACLLYTSRRHALHSQAPVTMLQKRRKSKPLSCSRLQMDRSRRCV